MEPRIHRITTSDATILEAEEWGAPGDPVVLLIAGTSCTRDWWPPEFCRLLAASQRRVVRYDQRDTGAASTWAPGQPEYTLSELARDAGEVLDFFRAPTADVAGFSQGGWVAQLLALDHPARISSLTLISTRSTEHGPADADLPDVSPELLDAWSVMSEPDWSDSAAVVDYYVMNERLLAGDAFDEPATRAICTAAIARSTDIRSAANHTQMPPSPRWRERLSQIAAPTTVLHGTADPLFPLGNGVALSEEIPNARFVPLEGVGHELPARVWPTVIEAIGRAAQPH